MTRTAHPTAATPGWTRAEYTTAGVPGRDAQQGCRQAWLPPAVAGLLRANTDLTWRSIGILAETLPVRLMQRIAEHGWASDGDLLGVLMFFHQQHASGTDSWIRYGGGNVHACTELASLGVTVDALSGWGYAVGAPSPAAALAPLLADRLSALGLAPETINGWLRVAALSTARASAHGRGPRTPLDLTTDLFVGGRSGLYAAAGVSVTEALDQEKPHWIRQPEFSEHLTRLVTLAGLRGHRLPAAAWWAAR